MILRSARFTAKYEMPFWSKVQSIADKYHLSSIRDYAEIKWREKTGGSLTLISTALNIKESKLNKEASS